MQGQFAAAVVLFIDGVWLIFDINTYTWWRKLLIFYTIPLANAVICQVCFILLFRFKSWPILRFETAPTKCCSIFMVRIYNLGQYTVTFYIKPTSLLHFFFNLRLGRKVYYQRMVPKENSFFEPPAAVNRFLLYSLKNVSFFDSSIISIRIKLYFLLMYKRSSGLTFGHHNWNVNFWNHAKC